MPDYGICGLTDLFFFASSQKYPLQRTSGKIAA